MNKELVKASPLHVQVRDSIRSAILSGELKPGMRIPSNQELCQTYKTGSWAVQSAMSALEREGLIERRQHVGSFVKGDSPRLTKVGIYYDVDFWSLAGMDYYRLLCGKLQNLLDDERVSWRLFHGKHSEEHFPREVLAAAKSREIQALLIPLMSHVTPEAFEELEIPVVKSGSVSPDFDFDFKEMLSLACSKLAGDGCKSAGFISSTASWDTCVFDAFKDASNAAGLRTEDAWIEHPAEWVDPCDMERFGYETFCRLKEGGSMPDGLFVFPDIVAKGVILGVLDRQIKIPEELKLVLHGNEGMPLFKPFPAVTIEASPAQAAATMLDIARRRVAGESLQKITLHYKVMEA